MKVNTSHTLHSLHSYARDMQRVPRTQRGFTQRSHRTFQGEGATPRLGKAFQTHWIQVEWIEWIESACKAQLVQEPRLGGMTRSPFIKRCLHLAHAIDLPLQLDILKGHAYTDRILF